VGARILLIEDNADNRELMAYLLSGAGNDVVLAQSGPEGVELACRQQPDVILLDLHMPEVDGFETARRIKRDPELQQIPLVAVTAVAMVGDRETVLKLGFDGYISKPIAPRTFAAEVQTYVASRASTTADAGA
jgi:two-component system cell cycle response regulator DivK